MPHRRGPKPIEKISTRTPHILAATKCPNSCSNTKKPRMRTPTVTSKRIFCKCCILPRYLTTANSNLDASGVLHGFAREFPSDAGLETLYFFGGQTARLGVGRKHVGDALHSRSGHPVQNAFDHRRDFRKRQPPLEKSRHSHFVCRIQRARQRPTFAQCMLGKLKTRELPRGHVLKP